MSQKTKILDESNFFPAFDDGKMTWRETEKPSDYFFEQVIKNFLKMNLFEIVWRFSSRRFSIFFWLYLFIFFLFINIKNRKKNGHIGIKSVVVHLITIWQAKRE